MKKTFLALSPLLLILMLMLGMAGSAQDTPTLAITAPANGATVDPAGFTVSGTGANLFEGNVVVRALDANGATLAQQATVLAGGAWSVSLSVNAPAGSAGSIFAFSQDGQGNVSAQATISVIYGEGEPTEEPTQEPTAEITPSITITRPTANEVVPAKGEFLIEGSATAVHEGSVTVRVLDTSGNVLAQGSTVADGAALGGTGEWSLSLTVDTEADTLGSVYAFSTSPDDGSVVAEDSVAIRFGPLIVIDDFAVTITSPGVGAVINTASFTVTGTALNAPDNRVRIQARDANDRPIVTGTVNVDANGAWSGTLIVNFTQDVNGSIVAFFNDPDDGSLLASQSVDVLFKQNCTVRAEWTTIYTVQRGDTLSRIAAATGTTFNELARANCLNTVNTILVGQQLRVPREVNVDTPVESSLAINIEVPGDASVLDTSTPIEVSGTAEGLSETDVIVLALDNQGNILAEATTSIPETAADAQSSWSVTLEFEADAGTQGLLYAYAASPADGAIEVADAVNVVYGQAESPIFVNISEPLPFAVIEGDTVTVSGMGGGLFEGNVVVEIADDSGNVLAQLPTTANAPQVGGVGEWSADLTVDVEAGTRGIVTAYTTSAQDGSVIASFSVPVRFGQFDLEGAYVNIISPLPGSTFDAESEIVITGTANGNNATPVIVQLQDLAGDVIATQAVLPAEGNLWTTSFILSANTSEVLQVRAFFADANSGAVVAADRVRVNVREAAAEASSNG